MQPSWFLRRAAVGVLALAPWIVPMPTARADDPPRAARLSTPACPKHRADEPAGRRPRAVPMPGMTGMPQVFEDMMESLARNPAGGFQDFLSTQERRALSEVRLSPAEERRSGRRWRDAYLRQARERGYPKSEDPEKLRYLRDLVEVISRRMAHRDRYPQLEVSLIEAPIADGQSFPGGYLVFTTALLE